MISHAHRVQVIVHRCSFLCLGICPSTRYPLPVGKAQCYREGLELRGRGTSESCAVQASFVIAKDKTASWAWNHLSVFSSSGVAISRLSNSNALGSLLFLLCLFKGNGRCNSWLAVATRRTNDYATVNERHSKHNNNSSCVDHGVHSLYVFLSQYILPGRSTVCLVKEETALRSLRGCPSNRDRAERRAPPWGALSSSTPPRCHTATPTAGDSRASATLNNLGNAYCSGKAAAKIIQKKQHAKHCDPNISSRLG